MGPIGCPETSVRNYHYSPRNNPEERSSHLRGVSLKSRMFFQLPEVCLSLVVHLNAFATPIAGTSGKNWL
jgi:hypothetical protein